MSNNVPIYITDTIDGIFIDYVDCFIVSQYQDILKHIDKIGDTAEKNDNRNTFFYLIKEIGIKNPIDFNSECALLYQVNKIHRSIAEALMVFNDNINGNPDFFRQPFVVLVDNKLIKSENIKATSELAQKAQKLMKTRYPFVIQEFEEEQNKRISSNRGF